jgi:uncharacterized membrane protein
MVASMAVPLALLSVPKMVGGSIHLVTDIMIGVAIAIALVPPASVIGIDFALNSLEISVAALLTLIVNLVGLDFFWKLGYTQSIWSEERESSNREENKGAEPGNRS